MGIYQYDFNCTKSGDYSISIKVNISSQSTTGFQHVLDSPFSGLFHVWPANLLLSVSDISAQQEVTPAGVTNSIKIQSRFGSKNYFFQKSILAMEVPANGNSCLELMTAEHQFYLPTLGKAGKAVGGATALAQKRAWLR